MSISSFYINISLKTYKTSLENPLLCIPFESIPFEGSTSVPERTNLAELGTLKYFLGKSEQGIEAKLGKLHKAYLATCTTCLVILAIKWPKQT